MGIIAKLYALDQLSNIARTHAENEHRKIQPPVLHIDSHLYYADGSVYKHEV